MTEINSISVPDWHREKSPLYDSLGGVIATTIAALLKSRQLAYLAVSTRTKSLESITAKLERKGYLSVSEITDLLGARIITYIESDVRRVCDLIELAFKIHPEKSIDKSTELQSNKIGYRSVHYICELSPERVALPELAQYNGLLFEIQVRTVLQHAWAEIEHDRSYKFSGELPAAIKRQLNLLAGTLEIIDGQFDLLAKEVDKHESEAKIAAKSGELAGVEVTSAGLTELLLSIPEIVSLNDFSLTRDTLPPRLFEELRANGIETLDQFKKLLNPEFIASYAKNFENHWVQGSIFVRAAMAFHDVERYFDFIKDGDWGGISYGMASLLDGKYGPQKIDSILKRLKIVRLPKDGKPRTVRRSPRPERKV